MVDKGPREPSKMERRAAEAVTPPPVIAASPAPVPSVQPVSPDTKPAEPIAAAAQTKMIAEPAVPPAPPPQAAPPVQPTVTADNASKLGLQQPVALQNPTQEPHAQLNRREVKRLAAEKRKAERRQLAEQRREQRVREAEQRAAAQQVRRIELEDDEREERPFFMWRERGGMFGGRRLFGDD